MEESDSGFSQSHESEGGKGRSSGENSGHARGMSDEMFALYKSILESNKLRKELKQQLELIAIRQAEDQSGVEEAREVAAEQARAGYRCEGCGLWFFGILDFAEHDEETGHMRNRGRKVTINGNVASSKSIHD